MFDDGTGTVLSLDSSSVSAGPDAGHVRGLTASTPHHGVGVELSDGILLVSEGDTEQRSGVRALDADGHELASSTQCPGVHGEAVAANESVVFGCADGALVWADGGFTKITSPDADGRLGTLVGSDASDVVLADYSTEGRALAEGTSLVALIDTRAATMRLVELPTTCTFRSLARDADGSGVVLGTDGALHVIEPATGRLTGAVPVVDPWHAPEAWQDPRPTALTFDGSVYVTDPARRSVHAVDVQTARVWRSGTLEQVPNEIVGVTGEPVGRSLAHDHDHDEHDGR